MIDFDGLFLATLQLECRFSDDIGNQKTGSGTGFALKNGENLILVTNRHMLDPSYIDGESKLKLSDIHLWCRRTTAPTTNSPPEKFQIGLAGARIILHPTADVALISDIQLCVYGGSKPIINPMTEDSLAGNEFFSKELGIADSCVFIGYPSNNLASPWWDTSLQLPIVRLANISSYPQKDFVNADIKSTHARLVTGLSFSGSSGSPIINLGTQFRTKDGYVSLPGAIIPKIIGIMAGHWWDDKSQIPEMLRHTGLSYFVSSIAISELVAKI